MQNSGLKWEINWIKENKYLYDSKLHYKSVIQNIITPLTGLT